MLPGVISFIDPFAVIFKEIHVIGKIIKDAKFLAVYLLNPPVSYPAGITQRISIEFTILIITRPEDCA